MTAPTIVETGRTRRGAQVECARLGSSGVRLVSACRGRGRATMRWIVQTEVTNFRSMCSARSDRATRRRSSRAQMAAAFQNCGVVTSMTTAATTVTKFRLMRVARSHVRPVGHAAKPTTAASLTGLAATEQTTVATEVTRKNQRVHNATKQATSGVPTGAVYQSAGSVISMMIAETEVTKTRRSAHECIASAPSRSSLATTVAVLSVDGAVTMTTAVVMDQMKKAVV